MGESSWVRRVATAAGVGVGTAGALAGVLLLGPVAASVLLIVVFAIVWPLAAVIRHVAEQELYQSPLLIACLAAGVVLALPGTIRLLAWGASGFTVALVFAGLFAVSELLRSVRKPPWRKSRASTRLEKLSHQDLVEDDRLIAALQCPLTIEELCGVWRETAMTLAQGAGPRDRQAVAEVRRICLDEFERRDPTGFHRWLAAGASTDPGKFLLPDHDN